MNQLGRTDRMQTTTSNHPTLPPKAQTSWPELFTFNQESMRRITGLIQLSFGILNGLILLRFLLKLMAANPNNVFASFIYTITAPFLWVFLGLTRTPSFEGIVIEFYDLVAIAVYAMLGWIIVRLLWLMFGRLR
ncbi:MAG: YggT family protein [Chloroflexi bacterium]|nr:YggT family protein [Chloroflexota bacterium]